MIPTTAPLSTRLDSGTAPSSNRTTRIGMMVGWGCCEVPNASSIVACAVSRTPSEATSFASGASGAQRPEDRELDRDADDDHEDVGERDRKRSGEREAELSGAERPEGEAGEHGDRARREVDESGAPVRDHDADRDGGDRRPGPQAEQEEEEGLFHVVPCLSADGAGVDRPRRLEGRCSPTRYLGGPIQPDARLNANLPW